MGLRYFEGLQASGDTSTELISKLLNNYEVLREQSQMDGCIVANLPESPVLLQSPDTASLPSNVVGAAAGERFMTFEYNTVLFDAGGYAKNRDRILLPLRFRELHISIAVTLLGDVAPTIRMMGLGQGYREFNPFPPPLFVVTEGGSQTAVFTDVTISESPQLGGTLSPQLVTQQSSGIIGGPVPTDIYLRSLFMAVRGVR